MKVYSVLNFKGGTGKSSVVENLADALHRRGKRVLVLDGDRQRNSSSTLLRGDRTPTLADVIEGRIPLSDALVEAKPGLHVVPGSSDLDATSSYIVTHRKGYYVVRRELVDLQGIDVVLVDHAGAFTPVMEALLLASEAMLIPCELEPYAVSGLFDMFRKLKENLTDHTLQNAGIIPYNIDLRYGMTRQYLDDLRKEFGDLITAPVRTDALVRNAQSLKMTVLAYEETYNEKSRAAEDFRTLADDLIEEYGL